MCWPALDLHQRLAGDGGAGMYAMALATRTIIGGEAFFDLRDSLRGIVGLWALCACAMALRMVLGLLWIARAVKRSDDRHRLDQLRWEARLSRMALGFGVGGAVRLRIVDTLASPVTAGWWCWCRPRC